LNYNYTEPAQNLTAKPEIWSAGRPRHWTI